MRRGVGGLLVAALFVLFLSASAGAEDPAGLAPVPADKWDAVKAAHLLKRAGFGGLPQEVLRLASMSPEQAVSSMVDWDRPREPESLTFPRFDEQRGYAAFAA